MGTKIHCESYLPIYSSTGDLKKDSCSGSWPLFYGDRTITNGQCYSGFMPRTMADGYPGLDMDVLKQKILEHEAVFKNQVCELHRLYRIQQDLMEEVRRKEQQCRVGESTEPLSSLSLQGSRVPLQGAQQWHMAGFPLFTSGHSRTSTSGVNVVNSPISSTKENGTQLGRFPFPNVSVPKEPFASESRPLKVRRKSIDLQLPAEECIDPEEGEKLPETKVSNISSGALNRNLKIGLQSNQKLSLEGSSSSLETDCRTAASASASQLRNPTHLADLNEPVVIEEAIVPSSVVSLVRSTINVETKGINQPANPNASYEYLERSGSSKSILSSTTHGFQQDQLPKPSKPMQSLTSQAEHPSGMYSTGYSRADLLRNGNGHCLESSDRSYDHSSNGHLVQGVSSQAPGSFPLFGSSLNGSWAHSVSSWANTNDCTKPKMPKMELPFNPSAPMSRALEDSSLSQEPSRGNWRPGDLKTVNGFSLGSASVLKGPKVHLPSSGVELLNPNCNTVAPNCSHSRGFGNFPVGSYRVDSSSVLDIDLNEDVSMGSLDEAIGQASTSIDGKNRSSLPWFSCKPSQANVAVDSKNSEPAGNASYRRASENLCSMREVVKDLNRPCTPENKSGSSDCLVCEIGEVKKETLSRVSTSVSDDCCPKEKNPIKERKNGIIDINLEYELDEATFEEMTVTDREQKMGTSRREFIDLNSCVSDIEDSSVPSYESKTTGDKAALDIDLEAPILQEDDCGDDDNTPLHENTEGKVSMQSLENDKEDSSDEVLGNAAEALVAISSSCPQIPKEDLAVDQSEASLAESLLWFVDALSANGFERPLSKKLQVMDFSKMDQFEAVTLLLPETKQADYMPNPFVPEVPDNGANALTMSRRVQSRRGRQRRDFQRDILPGLVSLSRPEMTEDLQVFATLMRATGHSWNSGLTRRTGTRSGGARGRRRAVVENVPSARTCTPVANGIEACLEDRSLTGWGKTLRRPRRQRCHGAGNPPAPAVC